MDDMGSIDRGSPAGLPEFPASSPPMPSSQGSQRPKRPPPITPKRFNKFFNPRSSRTTGKPLKSRGGNELRELTSNEVNRRSLDEGRAELYFDDLPTERSSKRRKASDDIEESLYMALPDSSPVPRSSPCQRTPQRVRRYEVFTTPEPTYCLPIRKRMVPSFTPDVRYYTSRFYSNADDVHRFTAVPFSTAACNTNSLVAIGDELGYVHLIESAKNSKPEFSRSYLSFRPHEHENAIMHMTFSSDDGLLATGSGDQTASIVDMPTQTVTHILRGHQSSVKQVAFQPGNDNVLATSCRDGVVCLWDLRTSGQTPAISMRTLNEDDDPSGSAEAGNVMTPKPFSKIIGDHPVPPRTTPRRPQNVQELRLNASITSLKFLGQGCDHLFLTAADATSHIRLWDIRSNYGSRRGSSFPLAITGGIESHEATRHYGVNSLSLSTDGSRLYSICRDSAVYVYSTNHLILGQAPDLSSTAPSRRAKGSEIGLGPLYGIRHPKLWTTSFYIHSSIRKASSTHEELLAVGSGLAAGGPMLFSTNEKILKNPISQKHNSFPVYNSGTWLTGGHSAEVTGVAWTSEGELVSLSDDGTARAWREGTGSRHHGWGWADVEAEWLEDDG